MPNINKVAMLAIAASALEVATMANANVAEGRGGLGEYDGCMIADRYHEIARDHKLDILDVREEMWILIRHHRAKLLAEAPVIGLMTLLRNVQLSNDHYQKYHTRTE